MTGEVYPPTPRDPTGTAIASFRGIEYPLSPVKNDLQACSGHPNPGHFAPGRHFGEAQVYQNRRQMFLGKLERL